VLDLEDRATANGRLGGLCARLSATQAGGLRGWVEWQVRPLNDAYPRSDVSQAAN